MKRRSHRSEDSGHTAKKCNHLPQRGQAIEQARTARGSARAAFYRRIYSQLVFNNKRRKEPAKQTNHHETGVAVEGEEEGPPEADVVGADDDGAVDDDQEDLGEQATGAYVVVAGPPPDVELKQLVDGAEGEHDEEDADVGVGERLVDGHGEEEEDARVEVEGEEVLAPVLRLCVPHLERHDDEVHGDVQEHADDVADLLAEQQALVEQGGAERVPDGEGHGHDLQAAGDPAPHGLGRGGALRAAPRQQQGEVLRDAADEVDADGADAEVDPGRREEAAVAQGVAVPEDVEAAVDDVADADVVGVAGVDQGPPRARGAAADLGDGAHGGGHGGHVAGDVDGVDGEEAPASLSADGEGAVGAEHLDPALVEAHPAAGPQDLVQVAAHPVEAPGPIGRHHDRHRLVRDTDEVALAPAGQRRQQRRKH
eukprot:166179-Hanusia_phi.AAC.5